jgi:transcriptional regulator GlxA family with amidase domain
MNIGILIFPGAEELDFIGPWEMLTMWNKLASGINCMIIAEHHEPVICAKGLSVNPNTSIENCLELDYLFIPGGHGTRIEVSNTKLTDFIRQNECTCKAILSVCTGAFLLHAAGILSGKRATTHWASMDRLRALGDVKVEESRYVRDGQIWTSAGVSAGIDMTLAFIADVAGEEMAGKVQLHTEYYPSVTKYGDFDTNPDVPSDARE